MNTALAQKRIRALTVGELLLVMAVLAILAAMFLPALTRARIHDGMSCGNNLRMISVAFKNSALDYNGRYPMQVSTNEGGTREYGTGTNAFVHFRVMSNDLSSPKFLVCPRDPQRHYATNFNSDFNDSTLSYFVGLEATQTNAAMFLCGDRNLTNGVESGQKRMKLTSSTLVGWTHELHGGQGNICFGDVTVQPLTTPQLRQALQRTGTATNWLVIP